MRWGARAVLLALSSIAVLSTALPSDSGELPPEKEVLSADGTPPTDGSAGSPDKAAADSPSAYQAPEQGASTTASPTRQAGAAPTDITTTKSLAAKPTEESDSGVIPLFVSGYQCNGNEYLNRGLVGYGVVRPELTEKFGDTLGGFGGIIFENWNKVQNGSSYEGTMWALPGRGYSQVGSVNYEARLHKFRVTFTPKKLTPLGQGQPSTNLNIAYQDSIKLTAPGGEAITGVDPNDMVRYANYPRRGFPAAFFAGSGFPNSRAAQPAQAQGRGRPQAASGNVDANANTDARTLRMTMDPEGLVITDEFIIVSEEYGPYIYFFSKETGEMVKLIRPPDAYIPFRDGQPSFSATGEQPESGRANERGFVGLTLGRDGETITAMLQSPLIQDGGNGTSSRNTRLVKYRIATDPPTLLEQYVVQLPSYTKDDVENVAVQNAILQVTDTQYLMLTTDEGAGAGLRDKTSAHRRIEIFDLAEATKLAPETQARGPTIANPDTGVLNEGIQAGESCKPWLDINDAKELAKFGLYNGNVAGAGLLNEKWEGLAAVPVNDGNDGEYFLFVSSDNGFRTRTVRQNGGQSVYEAVVDGGSGLFSQFLVYQVKLPEGAFTPQDGP